jgi:hypothetical protein
MSLADVSMLHFMSLNSSPKHDSAPQAQCWMLTRKTNFES